MLNRKIYLTFDLEEFDIPHEYGQQLDRQTQVQVSEEGLLSLVALLERYNVSATFFTTAAFAQQKPLLIQQLALRHEIASHSYYHSSFREGDLLLSKLKLEEISGSRVSGLRMPRMKQVPVALIKQAGYSYDSSINPIKLPGRYNFGHLPCTGFLQDGLLRIPASVATPLRIPLFWLSFKNLPLPLYRQLATSCLRQHGYLNLYFHPWEFADIARFKIPAYVKRHAGRPLLNRLETLITRLAPYGQFSTLNQFAAHAKSLPAREGF